MNPRSARSRWRTTIAAALFATASLAWAFWSIRSWLVEQEFRSAGLRRLTRIAARPEPSEDPHPSPTHAMKVFANRSHTHSLSNAADLFRGTQIWTVHLRLGSNEWLNIQPRPVESSGSFRGPDGRMQLRNPAARRNGLSGVRGIEFEWVEGDIEFEDLLFPGAAVRYKGNGTFMRSQGMAKRPFKVDLDRYNKTNVLAGRHTLNFANLVADDSCLHDAMAYEFFRAANVPAPRTAYSRMFVSTNGTPPAYLGVYALIENLDAEFSAERFGTRDGVFFKPVTTELFADLGDDWAAYDGIYDPKSKPSPAQKARVIELARLVSHSDDRTFAEKVGEYVELDEFARFLSVMVLLASYDGFLNNGQNFYIWLSPDTGKFQFLPWDLDNAWGRFGGAGNARHRVQASIQRPWIGEHRFLERMLAVPSFRQLYLRTLRQLFDESFVPERLHRRVDELAGLLRPLMREESRRKGERFEIAVTSTKANDEAVDGRGSRWNRPPHPIKWFISERARSVRAQLEGETDGVVLERGW